MKYYLLFVMICCPIFLLAQEEEKEAFRHHHIVFGLGHSHIPSGVYADGSSKHVLVPTFGFGYEYLFNEKISLGWKNDLEISNYIIEDGDENKLERENPFASSLVFIFSPTEHLNLYAGPGIEFESEENLAIFLLGLSYEFELGNSWDITPEFTYELKGGHTTGFGISLMFGKKL